MLQISLCIFCFRILPPCLISSPIILSVHAALFVFSLLIIVLISLYIGGTISSWLSVLSLICCCLSAIIDTHRKCWKYSFHLASISSICEIMLPLVSLQVVGKIVCCGLKIFISWKKLLALFFYDYILFVIFCCSSTPFFFRLIRTFASILSFLYVSWLALVFFGAI